jgi:hypothetical protein
MAMIDIDPEDIIHKIIDKHFLGSIGVVGEYRSFPNGSHKCYYFEIYKSTRDRDEAIYLGHGINIYERVEVPTTLRKCIPRDMDAENAEARLLYLKYDIIKLCLRELGRFDPRCPFSYFTQNEIDIMRTDDHIAHILDEVLKYDFDE